MHNNHIIVCFTSKLCNEVSSVECHADLPAIEVNEILDVVWHTVEDCLSLDLRYALECARTLQPSKRSLLKIAIYNKSNTKDSSPFMVS